MSGIFIFIFKKGEMRIGVLARMKQHFCKHKFVKHYNREQKAYERRCVKCGKVW